MIECGVDSADAIILRNGAEDGAEGGAAKGELGDGEASAAKGAVFHAGRLIKNILGAKPQSLRNELWRSRVFLERSEIRTCQPLGVFVCRAVGHRHGSRNDF